MYLSTSLLLASIATATPLFQRSSYNPEAPPIAFPAGISPPSIAGFKAATVSPSRGGAAICINGIVSVAATALNNKLDDSVIPTNQTELIGQLVASNAANADPPTPPKPQIQSVNGTWDIGASLCLPANLTQHLPSTVQFATHGVGFDKFYWDFAPGYSYVDSGVSAGHAVFIYDRLGQGDSEHPDPLTVQASLESEIAHSLVEMLRNGYLAGHSFQKIVGVGHSFGSQLTQSLTLEYPTLFDATVLTGFGTNSSAAFLFGAVGNPTFASVSDPVRFGDLPKGYTASSTVEGVQIDFFSYPGFDGEILQQAFAQRGLSPIGEMLGAAPAQGPSTNYTRPVAVVNGDEDLPFCNSNCSWPQNVPQAAVKLLYPSVKASDAATYIAPNAGHGLNLHYSCQGAYEFIQKFLIEHGL